MRIDIEPNETFLKAASFVIHTDRPIFLTGKAGTGKTTFLKYIQKNCPKKLAIAAPTGVAAINAGGTTLHSLFHLPFGTYLKDYALRWDESDNNVYNRHRLLSKIKFSVEKRNLIQELDLLIIDEVSMLRADMLDAIDDILKSVRRDMRPFWGFTGFIYWRLISTPTGSQTFGMDIDAKRLSKPVFL
ncbi:AAA family ATPase [Albibacterium sp.]|uniref:AAA family ATPase n=1 Tax=Albibacterium sp. TaxID=2952885 RepID=UPI002CCEEBF0|nr:AAA family ATPase [Albibacterium sp.]HUH17722.1 AAA family ATPase [Albibacterium sp.]